MRLARRRRSRSRWTSVSRKRGPSWTELTADAVSHWDEPWKTWRAELGEWTVRIGRDASTMEGEAKFTIDEDLEWTGI